MKTDLWQLLLFMNKILPFILGAILLSSLGIIVFKDNSIPAKLSFSDYKRKFNLEFDSTFENNYRQRLFEQNVAKMEAHNSRTDKTYEMGVNQFTHLTQEEFASNYLTLQTPSNIVKIETISEQKLGEINWVVAGGVSPIKNQGSCGACWAFSACAAIQGAWFVEKGHLIDCSVQQLIDCTQSYGNHGCNGGLMDNAWKYAKDHGVTSSSQYPYTSSTGTCKINTGVYNISGYVTVQGCPDLQVAIYKRPISVAVDASNWSAYRSGIFNNCKTSLNHGVLLAGVTDRYWLIKNSWGTSWGQSGYIRLAKGNTCGVCNFASYPYIEKP